MSDAQFLTLLAVMPFLVFATVFALGTLALEVFLPLSKED